MRELATLGPGRFVAELGILTGERVFATAVVREPGSVLVVPVDRLQEVIAQDQQLSDVIVQVMLAAQAMVSAAAGRPADRWLGDVDRMPGGCGSSRPVTGCLTSGSTWTPTRRRVRCSRHQGLGPE